MHTLGFTQHPGYSAIAERGFNVVFAGRKFAHWLIDRNLLREIPMNIAQDGDFVFYFDDRSLFRHAGVMIGKERVRSKWGTGHLFEHGVFEVPESYGTTVRFFKQMAEGAAYSHFRSFAEECGMVIEGS